VECSTPPTLALGDSGEDGWFRLRWTTTAVVADERIHLEELRRMVVNISVTRNISLTMFSTFILI